MHITVPAGFPAQRDLWQRIERARLLELEEGVREPVVYEPPSLRGEASTLYAVECGRV